MAGFKLERFSGIRPRASDVRLAVHEAVTAKDVDLRRGLLRPRRWQLYWDGPEIALPVQDPGTIYRFHRRSDGSDFWMWFSGDVDIVPGPAESAEQRHYYTGDGEPRMFTADSIDDTTPPYSEPADTKYPYTWFKLGVPAPETAPEIDAEAVPEPNKGSVGLITKVEATHLALRVNANIYENTGYIISGRTAGSDARKAGLNISNIQAQGGQQILTCLRPGLRMRVTEIVDGDTVKVVAAGRTGPIEDMGMIDDGAAWRWDNGLPDRHRLTWLTRLYSNYRRKSYFLLPEEVQLTIENHVLRVGDIIRITGSSAPMSWASTPEMVTTPVATSIATNVGYREARPDTNDNVVFLGATSFMIERDGASIDPVVPATAAFEVETRSYVYTYVTALGEESAPSPPSPPITIRVGDEVQIDSFAAPPTERRNIDRIWLYRTNTGTFDTAFQFVAEIPVAQISSGFTDDVPSEELGEVLQTEGWDVPPSNMQGLVALPNGFLAGFFDNVLCFSEPGYPHAWPEEYRKALDYDIVGLEVYGNALYVMTKGKPYVVIGVHPLQMSARRVETGQACIDKRSIVNTGDRILYCSPEGLISAGTSFVNVTDKHYTKEQWLELIEQPNGGFRNARAWYYDSQYILVLSESSDGSEQQIHSLVFDFRDEELRVTTSTEIIVAAYADPESSNLFYLTSPANEPEGSPSSGHRMLLRWDFEHPDADPSVSLSSEYQTGVIRLPRPMSFSCGRVICRRRPLAGSDMEAYANVELTVVGRRYDEWGSDTEPAEDDVTLVNALNVINGMPGSDGGGWEGELRNSPFRISVNTLVDAVYFKVSVSGPVEVEAIHLGESMEDLFET